MSYFGSLQFDYRAALQKCTAIAYITNQQTNYSLLDNNLYVYLLQLIFNELKSWEAKVFVDL